MLVAKIWFVKESFATHCWLMHQASLLWLMEASIRKNLQKWVVFGKMAEQLCRLCFKIR